MSFDLFVFFVREKSVMLNGRNKKKVDGTESRIKSKEEKGEQGNEVDTKQKQENEAKRTFLQSHMKAAVGSFSQPPLQARLGGGLPPPPHRRRPSSAY